MNGAANALFWKSSEAQNFTYLAILKHQNTKISLNKLSKKHWVVALFENFGSVRKKIQSTVFYDHPVDMYLKYWEGLNFHARVYTKNICLKIVSKAMCFLQHISAYQEKLSRLFSAELYQTDSAVPF